MDLVENADRQHDNAGDQRKSSMQMLHKGNGNDSAIVPSAVFTDVAD